MKQVCSAEIRRKPPEEKEKKMRKSMKKYIAAFAVAAAAFLLSAAGRIDAWAANKTLEKGKWENGTFTERETENYYKISVKKTGYLKIEYSRENEDAIATFSVCNGKKKKIWQPKVTFDHAVTVYFPVKKGTYYICIKDSSSWELDEDNEDSYNVKPVERYKVKYKFTAMKEGGKVKKLQDAPLLTKGKQVSGLIFPDKKSHDMCYRYVVLKKTKVKFSYEVFGLWLRIADSKGKFLNFDSKGRIKKGGDSVSWWEGRDSDFVTLPKGTYYFVIQKVDTGYYKLKLN